MLKAFEAALPKAFFHRLFSARLLLVFIARP